MTARQWLYFKGLWFVSELLWLCRVLALKSLPVHSFNALIIPILRGCLQSLFNDHLSGKELLIRFTASAFRNLLSVYVFSYFPFGFEGRMWDLIVSVPNHCLSFFFDNPNEAFQQSAPAKAD